MSQERTDRKHQEIFAFFFDKSGAEDLQGPESFIMRGIAN